MRFTIAIFLPTILGPVAALANSIPRALPDSFQVYGYGEGIGGLSIFSAGGEAFIGDYKLANDDEAAPVIFTPAANAWFASPNTTETELPTWEGYKFAIPSTSSLSREVTLIDNDTANVITDSFTSYGTVVFVTASDGTVESNWFAVPSDVEGVYALKWDENTAGGILLTLKATAPSS